MSYDLMLSGTKRREVLAELEATPVGAGVENWASKKEITLALPHGTEAASACFGELVRLARSHRCRIFDPQAGDFIDLKAVGRLPPAYEGPDTTRLEGPQPTTHRAVQVRLGVCKLAAALTTYQEKFGATLVRQTEHFAELDLLGVRLCLIPGRSSRTKLKYFEHDGARVFHSTLVVVLASADYDDVLQRFRGRGVYFSYPPARRSRTGEQPREWFLVDDFNGNFIEIHRDHDG